LAKIKGIITISEGRWSWGSAQKVNKNGVCLLDKYGKILKGEKRP
jgi:hypothetical protein